MARGHGYDDAKADKRDRDKKLQADHAIIPSAASVSIGLCYLLSFLRSGEEP